MIVSLEKIYLSQSSLLEDRLVLREYLTFCSLAFCLLPPCFFTIIVKCHVVSPGWERNIFVS